MTTPLGAELDRLRAENERMREAIGCAVLNARLVPDPQMAGATDIYAVPLDDIEELRELLLSFGGKWRDIAIF